jgi:hypothetical protein
VSVTEERPVLSGLIALAAVAVVVGIIGGLAIMFGVKTAGIGESSSPSGDGTAAGMYIPEELTDGETEEGEAPATSEQPAPGTEQPTQPETTPADAITLSSAQVSVAPMQQIDLTGTYPTGEGAILQVQRFENNAWTDFPVTISVSGRQFATYVLTSRPGENRFRVIDTDTQKASNPVTVTVG